MRYFIVSIILACSTLAWPFEALALEQVTLTQALQTALGDHPLVQSAMADTEAARADSAAAASRYLPRLSLGERFYATNEPAGSLFIDLNQESLELSPTADAYNNPPSRHDFETRLSLHQPLYDPDIAFQKSRAGTREQASAALLHRQREETALAVLQSYLAVQQAEARLAWAEQQVQEAEEITATATGREQAGVGLQADTLRSKVLLNDARRAQLQAKHEQQIARRRLALAMGLATGEIDITGPLAPDYLPPADDTVVLRRGDLQALDQAAVEANLNVHQQQAAYLPRASAQADYILHDEDLPFGTDANAWSVSAGLQWELFDFGERGHALAASRARQRAIELRRREQYRQAHLAVETAVLRAADARAALELAQSSLTAAEASRQLMQQRYVAGLATLDALLQVQTDLARVRSDLVVAEANQVRAHAETYFQQGTLLQALQIKGESKP